MWHHNHRIEHVHLLCIWHNFISHLCKPLAAYNILWSCNVPSAFPSDFPLTRPAFSPCHNFCHSFATCVAIAFARNASLPFRCHADCVRKNKLCNVRRSALMMADSFAARNPNFAIEFAARAFTPAAYLPVFFATDVAITFAPVGFFHPCCPANCHRHCHCHWFCPRGCHACCHQI